MKDLIVIRLAKNVCDSQEKFIQISSNWKRILLNDFIVIVIDGENETDKTTFEIVKQ